MGIYYIITVITMISFIAVEIELWHWQNRTIPPPSQLLFSTYPALWALSKEQNLTDFE